MSAFNTLLTELTCPRCGYRGEFDVEFKFGLADQLTYRLGEVLEWPGGYRRKPLRRPAGGNLDGEGYAECPSCGKDFWVDIDVREDRLVSATPDPDRPGYIP